MLILLKNKFKKKPFKTTLWFKYCPIQYLLGGYQNNICHRATIFYLCSIRHTEILTTDRIHVHALNTSMVWIDCNTSCCFRWENVLNEVYCCGLCQVFYWRWEGCQDIWALLWLWGQWTEGVGDQRMGLQVRGHL